MWGSVIIAFLMHFKGYLKHACYVIDFDKRSERIAEH